MRRAIAILALIFAVVLTALAIYLTPLKNFALVSPTVKDIDPAVFWEDYSANPDKYLFIDVRQANEYNASHARGAINMPIQTLFDKHAALPKRGKTIVLICTGGSLSGVAYGYLEHQGFLNLLRVKGGLRNWIVEGLPTESANIGVSTGAR